MGGSEPALRALRRTYDAVRSRECALITPLTSQGRKAPAPWSWCPRSCRHADGLDRRNDNLVEIAAPKLSSLLDATHAPGAAGGVGPVGVSATLRPPLTIFTGPTPRPRHGRATSGGQRDAGAGMRPKSWPAPDLPLGRSAGAARKHHAEEPAGATGTASRRLPESLDRDDQEEGDELRSGGGGSGGGRCRYKARM